MADALRSCNIDIAAYDNDISEAIIHLCDRLTSFEDAHSKRQTETSVQNENESLRQEMEKMAKTERTLVEKMKVYEHEIEEMKRSLHDASRSVSEEMRQKVSFLEQENLQLMLDVKSTKQQLQKAREESLRISVDEGPTLDFGDVGFQPQPSRKGGASASLDEEKEPSDTVELSQLARGYSESKGPVLKRPRESRNRSALSDSTNRSGKEKKPAESMYKRQKTSAVDKASGLGRQRVTPGLGESSSLDSEHTGECKQS
jgi:hypothetical protein